MNAILLHGKPGKEEYYNPKFPSASNYHWFPWLQKQLLIKGIKADTPEVPLAFDPQWDLWVKEAERFEIDSDTLLVGHSAGAGFWVRYLSEHKELKPKKLILVAPSLGYGWDERDFLTFDIDQTIAKRVKNVTIIYADNDNERILRAVRLLRSKIPSAKVVMIKGMGHFTEEDMSGPEFPELLAELLD